MSDYALTKEERRALLDESQQRRIAEMYLDLNTKWTIAEMADELGLTERQVYYLTSKESFTEIYNETLALVTGRARLSVLHAMQSEALVDAYKVHLDLIKASPHAVQLSAIRLLYQVLHLDMSEALREDDRDKFRDWQEALGKQFNIGEMNVYLQALDRTNPEAPPTVDGEVIVTQDEPLHNPSLQESTPVPKLLLAPPQAPQD